MIPPIWFGALFARIGPGPTAFVVLGVGFVIVVVLPIVAVIVRRGQPPPMA